MRSAAERRRRMQHELRQQRCGARARAQPEPGDADQDHEPAQAAARQDQPRADQQQQQERHRRQRQRGQHRLPRFDAEQGEHAVHAEVFRAVEVAGIVQPGSARTRGLSPGRDARHHAHPHNPVVVGACDDRTSRALARAADPQPRNHPQTTRAARAAVRHRVCRLGTGTAARKLGISVDTVPPGKRSCPYHFHYAQEPSSSSTAAAICGWPAR